MDLLAHALPEGGVHELVLAHLGQALEARADDERLPVMPVAAHGEVLAAAMGLRGGDHVVFMTEADVASLPALIWQYGAPVVAVLMLWIALALFSGEALWRYRRGA